MNSQRRRIQKMPNEYDTLNYGEFVAIGKQLPVGEMKRVNHDAPDCFGESNSMIVSRNMSGVIHAFCFRCGRRGVYSKERDLITPTKLNGTYVSNVTTTVKNVKDIQLPSDTNLNMREWPSPARLYVRKARISVEEARIHGIGYSASYGRVVIPVRRGGILIGYQLRRVLPKDKGPKYITKKHKDYFFAHLNKGKGERCVVCEDMLSAIRISKHLPAFCLFGTSFNTHVVKILKEYNLLTIYLDDDNEQVKKKQRLLKNTMENFVDDVFIIKGEEQPKDLSEHRLQRILGVVNGA
jgi:hypothetical protein